MYHNTTLKELMSQELPNLTFQRKMMYKPTMREVKAIYRLINKEIFNNKLFMPKIYLKSRLRETWGMCYGGDTPFRKSKSRCTITLADRWYCKQWLIMAIAHEMCHQYQWDILSKKRMKQGLPPVMSHGPSFYIFRDKLKKRSIPLKIHNNHLKWFKNQHLFRC